MSSFAWTWVAIIVCFVFFVMVKVLCSPFVDIKRGMCERKQKKVESLRKAIIENTRDLERVWSNKGLEKELVEGIKKEREKLWLRLYVAKE